MLLNKEQLRDMALQAKDSKSLTWPQIGERIGRSPVYAAMLVYGYGQATEEEATGLADLEGAALVVCQGELWVDELK